MRTPQPGRALGLADVSEVNANPRDPLDVSVFRLPPSLSHDTPAEKAKYPRPARATYS